MKNKIVLPLFLGLALAAGCSRTNTDAAKLSSTDQPSATKPTVAADPATADKTAIAQKEAADQTQVAAAQTPVAPASVPATTADSSLMATAPTPPASITPALAPLSSSPAELNPTPVTSAPASDMASITADTQPVIADRIAEWKLSSADIKSEFEQTGRIVRSKTVGAGEPTGPMDSVLASGVTNKLKADADTSSATITVKAEHGVITLEGSAHSLDQIGRALAVALDTGGVTQAISVIKLEPATQP